VYIRGLRSSHEEQVGAYFPESAKANFLSRIKRLRDFILDARQRKNGAIAAQGFGLVHHGVGA
jgi:hypothetical protein